MSEISLVIVDKALRAAIGEQLALTRYTISGNADLSEAVASPNEGVVIWDESAADEKNIKSLLSSSPSHKKFLLLLGKFDEEIAKNEGVSEALAKPLRLGQLLARLEYYLEVAPRLRSSLLIFGPYRLEPQSRQLVIESSGETIRLTEKETALLQYIGQSSKPVGREELLSAVWGYDARIDTHTLETHIYQLRRKIDPNDRGIEVIQNEDGGYFLKRK